MRKLITDDVCPRSIYPFKYAHFLSSRRSIKVKNSPGCSVKILCDRKSIRDEGAQFNGLMSRKLKQTDRWSV